MKLSTTFKLSVFLLIAINGVYAQQNIGIGTSTPDSSAILDLTSTNKGLLLPRMTKAQRTTISSPKAGLTIFQTDSAPGIYIFDGTKWLIQLLGTTSNTAAIVGSQTFNYTGGVQTFTVPAGVTLVNFELYGAQGGAGLYTSTVYDDGGLGGKTTGNLPVIPGDVINIFVGGKPTTVHSVFTGGYNGGGNGRFSLGTSGIYSTSGGGGGATDLRLGGTGLSDRVAVAGGGGGASIYMQSGQRATGGSGGGTTGGVGSSIVGFNGGTPTGGGQSAGGTSISGNNGTLGQGGQSGENFPSGGAGGGGYYGGAGSSNAPSTGGSGYVSPTVQNGVLQSGQNTGNGSVVISWNISAKILVANEKPAGSTTAFASSNNDGLLSSSDWSKFNNKSNLSLASITTGSILFTNATGLAQNNAKLFWNNTNNRLSVGTNMQGSTLTVKSTNNGSGTTDWVAADFGGTTGDRVVLGILNGKATIGAHNNDLNAWANLILQNGGGNVGINTVSPTHTLTVNGGISTTTFRMTDNAGSGKILTSDGSGNAFWSTLTNSNNFYTVGGIKVYTTNLSGYTDWIAGTFGGNTNSTGDRVVMGSANGKATISGHNASVAAWADLILSPEAGSNIGIGTTTPAHKLTVNGTTSTSSLVITSGAGAGKYLASDASGNANWISFTNASTTNTGLLTNTDWNTFNNKQNALSNANTTTSGILTSADWNTFNNKQNALSNANTTTNGILTSADWNTFNNKQNAISNANTTTNGILTSTDWNTFNNKATAASVAGKADTSTTILTSGPLSGGGNLSANRTLSIAQASATTNGYLTSADWNTFNNKSDAISLVSANASTRGLLDSDDWNTFNNKQNALSNANTTTNGILSSTDWNTFNNKASAASVAAKAETTTTINTTGPLSGGGDLSANRTLSIAQANTTTNGYLSSTDWNTFNNKQNTLSNANTTTNGILTSADWNTFNNKQNALNKASAIDSGYLSNADWNIFNNKSNFALPSLKSGSVLFSNGNSITQDTNNLFWDTLNKSLGIGNKTPDVDAAIDLNTYNLGGINPSNKGFLLPHVALENVNRIYPFTRFVKGMLVYNRNNPSSIFYSLYNEFLDEGIYFNDGSEWYKLLKRGDAIENITTPNLFTGSSSPNCNTNKNPLLVASSYGTKREKIYQIKMNQASVYDDGFLSKEDWNMFNNKLNALNKASANDSGYLSSADWNMFNNKLNALNKASAIDSGYLSSVDWNTFNGKQNALSNANTTTSGILTSTDWNTFNNKFSLPTLTSGSILFSNGTALTQNNAQFFWDNTNTRLGIGTNTPTKKLEINGTGGLMVSSTNNGSGTSDWVSGNFGAASGDRIVMGLLFGKATIGSHNAALNAWAPLYIQQGGNTVIGAENIAATEKLVVEGNIKATGSVKQTVYSQAISIGANNANSITWNHNLGYQPVIMMSLEGSSFAHFCTFAYTHNDNNTLTINLVNHNTSSGANVTVRWIVVN